MDFIEQLKTRTSVRDFTDEKMTEREIAEITEVINNAPTSVNNQQFSAIIIDDEKIKDFIATNNWNQQHIRDSAVFILFLADRSKFAFAMDEQGITLDRNFIYHEYTRAVIDATIAATQAHDVLVTMGYGVTFVGGVLGFIDKLKEYFKLPDTVFPVVGLSVGHPSKVNPHKPKMNKVFRNEYSYEKSIEELNKYSEETLEYFKSIGSKRSFKEQLAAVVSSPSYAVPFKSASDEIEKIIHKFR